MRIVIEVWPLLLYPWVKIKSLFLRCFTGFALEVAAP